MIVTVECLTINFNEDLGITECSPFTLSFLWKDVVTISSYPYDDLVNTEYEDRPICLLGLKTKGAYACLASYEEMLTLWKAALNLQSDGEDLS